MGDSAYSEKKLRNASAYIRSNWGRKKKTLTYIHSSCACSCAYTCAPLPDAPQPCGKLNVWMCEYSHRRKKSHKNEAVRSKRK